MITNNYKELKCEICEETFIGREPTVTNVDILCPKCLIDDELPIINDGDPIPETVNDEITERNDGDE